MVAESHNEFGGDTIAFMQQGTLTYVHLAAFPDDGLRREIIHGELLVTPAPRLRHQDVAGRLFVALSNHIDVHGGGRVYIAPTDVVLSDSNVVEPDVLFIGSDQLDVLSEANIQGVPALVAEVLSDPRTDRVRKRDLYASFGVPEYWVLDPDADRVEVYKLDANGYGKPEILEPGDDLTFEALPGCRVAVAALFRR